MPTGRTHSHWQIWRAPSTLRVEREHPKLKPSHVQADDHRMYESSPPPQLPPPTLPPPPPPGAQPNAASGPASLFAAVAHQTLTAQTDAPTTAKTGRPRRNTLVTSIIIFVALFGTTYLVLDAGESEPTSATVPPGSAVTVDTPDYHFVLPAEPRVQIGEQQMFGTTIPLVSMDGGCARTDAQRDCDQFRHGG